MRSSLLLAGLSVGCGDQKFTVVNAEPDVMITSHGNGDSVGEGQRTLFMGVVDDADDDEDELSATWMAGDRVVCEGLVVSEWGETSCEMTLAMRETEVSLFVADPRGSTGGATVRLDVIETDAPSVSIISPESEGRHYSDHPVRLEAVATDNEDFVVDLAVSWVGDAVGDLGVPAHPDSDGTIRADVAFPMGTHNLRVTVTDTSGKYGDDTVQIDVSGPNRSPSCAWLTPENGTVLVYGEPVSLSGRVDDPDVSADWLSVEWISDIQGLLGTSTPASDGAVSFTASDLDKAAHTITLRAVDEVGATCTAERSVVVSARPEVSIVRPVGESLYYSDHPIALDGIVTDEEDAHDSLVAEWSSDLDGPLDVATDVDADGHSTGAARLSAGVHIVTLTGTDADGVGAVDSSTISVRGPNQVPTCAVVAPLAGAGFDEASPVALEGLVDDADVGPTGVTVVWESDLDGSLGPSVPASDGAVSMTVPTLSVGTHTVSMVVTDEVGATCIDNTTILIGRAPSVAISAPSDGGWVNQGETTTFLGLVSDADDAPTTLMVEWASDRDGVLHEGSPDSAGITVFTADGLTVGTHTIALTATDALGLYATTVSVLEVNGLPTAPMVRIEPNPARTTDALSVAIDADGIDPEGEPVSYRFEWSVSGELRSESAAVTPDRTAKGEEWTVRVIPTDGRGEGPAGTDERAISNTVPVIESVQIGPDPLTTESLAVPIVTAVDPDDDPLTFAHAWTVDGAAVGDADGELDGLLHFDKHQLVGLSVLAMDDESSGDWVDADAVWVQNTPPTAPEIEIVPDAPIGGVDDLWCRVREPGYDADGDPMYYSVAWERDAYPYPEVEAGDTGMPWSGPLTDDWTGDLVPAADTEPSELWECAVTAWDDEEAGATAVASAELESPPPGCGDGILQPGEEVDPPISPFTEISIDPDTCRWDLSEVEQLYCYGMCSWAGPPGCDQADADTLCKLVMDNPLAVAKPYDEGGWVLSSPLSEAGFAGVGCSRGTLIDTDRGVPYVAWMDASLAAHHGGGGQVVAFPDCEVP
ncbi:MAG: hypothetical protein VX944_09360 [Myxococcota bacterium]|nr:hypothetical protein [Myxococcota bacterium]